MATQAGSVAAATGLGCEPFRVRRDFGAHHDWGYRYAQPPANGCEPFGFATSAAHAAHSIPGGMSAIIPIPEMPAIVSIPKGCQPLVTVTPNAPPRTRRVRSNATN